MEREGKGMCGRFISGADDISWAEYCQLLRLPTAPPLSTAGDSSPTQLVTVVRRLPSGTAREVASLSWGLLPPWARNKGEARRLFNVRGETAREKFPGPFERQRCVIPARAFYEWKKESGGRKRSYLIHDPSLPIFSMAGLWSSWSQGGESLETCTILTTAASPLLRPIHHRMPVIFDPHTANLWLDGMMKNEELNELLIPYESETFRVELLGPRERRPVQGSLFSQLEGVE